MQAEKLATEFEKLKYVEQADAGEGEHLKTIRDLQSELEDAKAEALSERKKVIAFFLPLLIIFFFFFLLWIMMKRATTFRF